MPDHADLVVKGRFVMHDGRIARATLLAREGRVLRLEPGDVDAPADADVREYGDALVMPGCVDAHVHFRDPGHPEKEDFTSGTTSAAFGGVTAVLDMPNTNPPTITRDALAEKKQRAAERAVVDFGLYCGLSDADSVGVLEDATAMKVYLGATTGDLLTRDWDLVTRAVTRGAELGKTVAFHAEDQGCLDTHADPDVDPGDWGSHARTRPNDCEAMAVARVAGLDVPAGARRHIAHLSTREALDAIKGTPVTCEVTPHHLYYEVPDLETRGGVLKMNPPLRGAEDRERLWAALRDARVDCVASDHAPHTRDEKATDVCHCPSGVPGVETMVPLLMAEVAHGRLDAARAQSAACTRPSEIFRLPKGRFAVGFDADFTVWDLDRVETVEAARLHSRAGWTPFEGLDAVFPTHVWLRGRPVVEDRRLVGAPGDGRFLDGRFHPDT